MNSVRILRSDISYTGFR